MRNALITLILLSTFLSCDKDEVDPTTPTEATILGRWVPVGFEDNIRYEFTDNKRFELYSSNDGTFPTLEEFQTQNPNLTGKDWFYSGDTIVVDLNFGNYSRLLPNFKCDNYVIEWINEAGEENGIFYREDHDITSCN